MDRAANAVFITDHAGQIIWLNAAFSKLSGYAPDEVIGKNPSLFKSGRQSKAFNDEIWQTILMGDVWRGIVIERRKDGVLITVDETITPLKDENGVIHHFLSVFNDITRCTPDEEKTRYLAFHDALTGLPNRAFFQGIQRQLISQAKRNASQFALLFLDIDNFKKINDSHGHETGDQLLLAVSERLRAVTRKGDTVARLGGDEFVIFLNDITDQESVTRLANKLLDTIATPFLLHGLRIATSVSIGIALYPRDGEEGDDLLRKADQAMYQAKQSGRNAFHFHEPD
jgi:diguanylate cyclase (GGDEF)-like protein/PAS domain S-box-containing protein